MTINLRLIAIGLYAFTVLSALSSRANASDQSVLEKACNAKDSVACFDLGYLEEQKSHFDQAKPAYQIACTLNNVHACTNLANLYYSRDKNIKAAEPLYEKSCEAGNMSGCNGLAYVLFKKDQRYAAAKVFKKACRGGFNQSCQRLRDMDFSGGSDMIGPLPDPAAEKTR